MSRSHKPKAGVWIRLCVLVVYPLDSALFKLRWHHLDRIPAEGAVLIAINHISQADTLATARMVWQAGRIPRFLIKSGVFTMPLIGTVLRGARQIPVHRGTSTAVQSLQSATQAIAAGECVIIYPEGTITHDPQVWPMQAKTGVARLALASPATPVIPVGQFGAHRTLGRGGPFRPWPRHRHEASVGNPVDLTRFHDRPITNELLREVTEQIMREVTAEVAAIRGEPAPEHPIPWPDQR